MKDDNGRHNLEIACLFVDELARCGLRHAVICPGSRSTPLAVAFAKHPRIAVRVLIDERGAGFFALGMARQLHVPVACLCTSGTAAANFLPAVIEASLSRIPLIVLTADRPPELRDWGAAQTIDQLRLFGGHAKWFAEMPVPADLPSLRRHARATAARAMQTSGTAPAGPVHLNVPFREPLLPSEFPDSAALAEMFASSRLNHMLTSGSRAELGQDDGLAAELAALVSRSPRGLIVCGPDETPGLPEAAAKLAAASSYPILADPLSSLRFGSHDRLRVVSGYDLFLRAPRTALSLAPDLVIRVGAMPTSKPLQQFLTAHPGRDHLLIDPGAPRDPFHLGSEHLMADPAIILDRVSHYVCPNDRPLTEDWLNLWLEADRITRTATVSALDRFTEFFEGRVVAELADLLPDGATLVVGNSMPVRDVDTFVQGSARQVRVVGTRGASGIDGVVSTALGAAAVCDGPVVLVVGDLSFYHDLNGLLAARKFGLDATIVVLNNNGGGIFSFLPQADLLDRETFEELFGTPGDLPVADAAELFGAAYSRPTCWPSFRQALQHSIGGKGLSIIEIVTDRETNLVQHRIVSAHVLESLQSIMSSGAANA